MDRDDQPEFVLRDEVEKVHPVGDQVRKRAEKAGLFPPRVKLGLHVSGWRRSEVKAWRADPKAWAKATATGISFNLAPKDLADDL